MQTSRNQESNMIFYLVKYLFYPQRWRFLNKLGYEDEVGR
jgi:hypothetical protein